MSAAVAAITSAASAAITTLAAAVPPSRTSAPAAFALRTRLVDDERPAEKLLAVESRDCFFGFGVVMNFGETKTARLPCETVAKQRQRIRLHSDLRE
jgi:hypothetical protein